MLTKTLPNTHIKHSADQTYGKQRASYPVSRRRHGPWCRDSAGPAAVLARLRAARAPSARGTRAAGTT